ncbi:ABC transporter ATP-binding protein [Lachnospiraceae bacterium LCP25S3_G4]
MNQIIEINHLTRDYGHHKGIFDVNIHVQKGGVFGFLGPNGAGKTTTIRHLMGFIKAKEGNCSILGYDCFNDAAAIQKSLGYLAGEIAFLEDLNGRQLLHFIASLKRIKDYTLMNELMDRFELDPRSKIKKMSKGMKQKVGIICAFMNDPSVIILDEPTSGLDPLMQNRFIELILEQKKRGKTILMSSHIFEEIEKTCDRAAIIRNGDIVAIEDMENLRQKKLKYYTLTFQTPEEASSFIKTTIYEIKHHVNNTVVIHVTGSLNIFLQSLLSYQIKDLDVSTQSLEDIFLHYYGGDHS